MRTDLISSLKVCSQCSQPKPLGRFAKNGGRLRSACKDCERGRSKPGKRQLPAVPRVCLQRMLMRQGWRCACGCGRSIRYAEAALIQWMRSRQRLSTSQQ